MFDIIYDIQQLYSKFKSKFYIYLFNLDVFSDIEKMIIKV